VPLTLHRTGLVEVQITKPGVNRAFVFDLELGVGQAQSVIDADSGMLVNLVQVDEWLFVLSNLLQTQSFGSVREFVEVSLGFLREQVTATAAAFDLKDVFVSRVLFHEKRGLFFGWDQFYFFGQSEYAETKEGVHHLKSFFRWNESEESPAFLNLTKLPVDEVVFKEHPALYKVEIEHLVSRVKRVYKK
jgi:hypothetical protein